jgi:O-antigen ligase
MIQIWRRVANWASGGEERAATLPLIAGYRRGLSRGIVLAGLLALAAICLTYGYYLSLSIPARVMPYTVPVVLLGAFVIWSLPTGEYAPTKALEPIFMAFFAALILWPNYLAIALPSLPWLTLLRIIGAPMVAVLLVCVSASATFRARLVAVLNTDKWIWRLLLAVVIFQTISLPLSSDPGNSLNRWVIAQVNWTAIFFVAVIVFMRRGFATYWVWCLLTMLTILCCFGLWEARLTHVPWAGHIPSFLKVQDETVQRILAGAARAATGIYRVQGVSTTSLGMAEILGLAIPFAMHLAFERNRIVLRILAALFIPLAVYVILLTDSRLGVVAALASVMFYLLIWALLRWRQIRKSLFGPAIVLAYPAIFAAFVASTFFIGRLRAQVWGDGSQQASTESRIDQWVMGIPKILRNPLGYGVGEGANILGFANGAGVITIDSYYLSIFLEIGVLGFIAYYGLMLRGIWTAARTVVESPADYEIRLLLPIAVALINYVIVKSVLSQDANHSVVFMMLGAVVALTYRARNPHGYEAAQPVSRSMATR